MQMDEWVLLKPTSPCSKNDGYPYYCFIACKEFSSLLLLKYLSPQVMPLERNFSISLFTEANTDDPFLNQDRVCSLYSLIEDVSLTSPLNLMCECRKRLLWSTGDGWLVSVLNIYVLLLVSKATQAWRQMNHLLSVIDWFYSCPHRPSVIWRRCW